MAVILDKEKDKDTATQPMQTGAGGAAGAAVAAQPGTQQRPSQPKGSGRFTDIQKYLSANQGAGQRLSGQLGATGQRLADKVGSRVDETQEQFSNRAASIREGIEAGRTGGIDAFKGAGQEQTPTNDDIDPTQNEQMTNTSAGSTAQFETLYGGDLATQIAQMSPDTLALQQQTEALRAQADRAKRGRFGLLQEKFGTPGAQYTAGKQALDELFLQATPEAGRLASQFEEQAAGVEEQLTGLEGEIGETISDLGTEAEVSQQALQDLFRTGEMTTDAGADGIWGTEDDVKEEIGEGSMGGYGDIASELEQRAEDTLSKQQANYDELSDLLQKAYDAQTNLTADPLEGDDYARLTELLGIDPSEGLWGVDFSPGGDFLQERLTDLDAGQVATDAEMERYKALAELAGEGAIPESEAISFGDRFDEETPVFQTDAFSEAVNKAKENFINSDEIKEIGQTLTSTQNAINTIPSVIPGLNYRTRGWDATALFRPYLLRAGMSAEAANDALAEMRTTYESAFRRGKNSGAKKIGFLKSVLNRRHNAAKDELETTAGSAGGLTGVGEGDRMASVYKDVMDRWKV